MKTYKGKKNKHMQDSEMYGLEYDKWPLLFNQNIEGLVKTGRTILKGRFQIPELCQFQTQGAIHLECVNSYQRYKE